MNYNDAIQFLYDLRLFGLKFGLENTFRLAELAGRPQDQLRFIHVAGTNGKGSTCAMLESIYREAGWRVGLFTSPHLVSFSERIQVNRRQIAPEDVTRLVEELRRVGGFAEGEGCATFFEAVTVMALIYFAEQKCDLVIWETGLGGRLDATNIVTPLASVITNVELDHQQWLGDTLPEIAREKAGIIKSGVPVITSAEAPEVLQVIREVADAKHAPLRVVTAADWAGMAEFELGLAGEHQRKNAAVAARVVRTLDKELPVAGQVLRAGLKNVHWAGRLQVLRRGGQTIVVDGAHNPAGVETLARAWQSDFAGQPGALILGIMRDKDCAAICHILAPLAAQIFLAPVDSERTADPQLLAAECRKANASAHVSVCRSLGEAFSKAGAERLVVVAGSLYFAGEALEMLKVIPPSRERLLNENAGPASIRAVTFDVGGTLIQPWPSVGHVYSEVAKRHGIDASPEILNQRFAAAWKAKKDFAHKKSDWLELVGQTFAGFAESPISEAFFSELYDQFARTVAWKIYDDVLPCLERLQRGGIRLAAISNWDERLRPLLHELGLDRHFETIIISAEAGSGKPSPHIFRRAAEQLGLPPQTILHIGDSRGEDYEGARGAGFRALLLERKSGDRVALPRQVEVGAGKGGSPLPGPLLHGVEARESGVGCDLESVGGVGRGVGLSLGSISSLDEVFVSVDGNKMPSEKGQAPLIFFNSIDLERSNH